MKHLRKFNEVWEPTLPNKYPNSTVELLRNEFGKFDKSKYNHMSEVRDIINRVAKLEKTESVKRYLDELHKYYATLDKVPANLMIGNIEYKSID